jgi:chaperone required for assembly of F1-ATPase
MSEWKAKRFWEKVAIDPVEGGFGVSLDGRPVRTPAKSALTVPTQNLAEAIAGEWRAQDKTIDPATMPFTRTANAAIDKVRPQHAEVADLLADYADSDLLCYRAEGPEALVARQAEAWDPVLDWADTTLGARLVPVRGVMHVAQSAESITGLRQSTHALSDFELAAFHDLVALTGSLILGFAAKVDAWEPLEIWRLSRIDETWQSEQWGVDEEAAATEALKKNEFLHAKAFMDALA